MRVHTKLIKCSKHHWCHFILDSEDISPVDGAICLRGHFDDSNILRIGLLVGSSEVWREIAAFEVILGALETGKYHRERHWYAFTRRLPRA